MKKISVLINGVLLAGLALFFAACKNTGAQSGAATPAVTVTAPGASAAGSGSKIAYVDIDTLEANYTFLKSRKEDFRKRQDAMEAELQRSYQQMQNDAAEVQKKAQANNLTQPEYEAAQKRLMQMQQSLETRKQVLTEQLMKDQETFNKELKAKLDSFLEDYNKNMHYDFILSYSASGSSSILHANKSLNITRDVIKGMNERTQNQVPKK